MVADAATDRAPTKITTWVRRLAGCFHGFYHDCPILADDVDRRVGAGSLWLVEATRIGSGHRARPARRLCSGVHVVMARPTTSPKPDIAKARPVAPRRPGKPQLVACMHSSVEPSGRLRVGGVDVSTWPRSSAPRCSSTTRPTFGNDAGRQWRRGETASPMPPKRSCAWRWPVWPTRKACAWTSRPVVNCTWRWLPVSPPTGWCFHGNNKSYAELWSALAVGSVES